MGQKIVSGWPQELGGAMEHAMSVREATRLVGRPVSTDTPSLAGVARRVLRERFLRAGIGVSGANFVVAETGTVVICTNEGNGRLVSSAPPVHVVVTGRGAPETLLALADTVTEMRKVKHAFDLGVPAQKGIEH